MLQSILKLEVYRTRMCLQVFACGGASFLVRLILSLHPSPSSDCRQSLAREQLLTTALGILLNVAEEAHQSDRQQLADQPMPGSCNFLHWLCQCCSVVRLYCRTLASSHPYC